MFYGVFLIFINLQNIYILFIYLYFKYIYETESILKTKCKQCALCAYYLFIYFLHDVLRKLISKPF